MVACQSSRSIIRLGHEYAGLLVALFCFRCSYVVSCTCVYMVLECRENICPKLNSKVEFSQDPGRGYRVFTDIHKLMQFYSISLRLRGFFLIECERKLSCGLYTSTKNFDL